MIEIGKGTLEEKVIKILTTLYPVTLNLLKKELGISKIRTERIIKEFQAKGIVELEILPDKTYIRLLRQDFHFVGRSPVQKKSLKRKGKKREKRDYEGMMYG